MTFTNPTQPHPKPHLPISISISISFLTTTTIQITHSYSYFNFLLTQSHLVTFFSSENCRAINTYNSASLMSISAQHRSLFIHTHNLQTQPHTTTRICSSITTPTKPRRNVNRITINEIPLSPPSLPQQQLPISRSIIDDPNLRSTWSHRAWVATGSITILTSLLKSATVSAETHSLLEPVLAGLLGYVLADLGSGVYHWGIDNYGDSSTPIFGSQIEAFQGHHKFPWTITKRQFSNNLHALARALTFFVLPIDLISNEPVFNAFAGVFAGCIMFSQQFHAWAHGTKSKLPPLVLALQDAGVLVSRIQHGAHHRSPYNNNYCIVSGAWNGFLDQQRVFEVLEMVIFFKFGVRPRSWSEPGSEWTEEIVGTPDLAEVSVSLDS